MNFIVIGLGSMGKRRIRILKQYICNNALNETKWQLFGIDNREDRRKEIEELFAIRCYSNIDEVIKNNIIDAAVVSTSPKSHSEIILECLDNNLHVFSEINLLSDNYDSIIKLAKKRNKVLFMSSTPMYRKEMQYIKDKVENSSKTFNYRYHIGQYLPEWHPWENYRDFFAGDKRTNGCREIFAIELPWMVESFGEIDSVSSVHSKITDLNIEYDDTYHVIVRHKSGIIGQMSVDVSTPKTERHLELWNENYYLEWSGKADSLSVLDLDTKKLKDIEVYLDVTREDGYNSFVIENAYYDELEEYIGCILGKNEARYSFEKDKIILDWIDRIEE